MEFIPRSQAWASQGFAKTTSKPGVAKLTTINIMPNKNIIELSQLVHPALIVDKTPAQTIKIIEHQNVLLEIIS